MKHEKEVDSIGKDDITGIWKYDLKNVKTNKTTQLSRSNVFTEKWKIIENNIKNSGW